MCYNVLTDNTHAYTDNAHITKWIKCAPFAQLSHGKSIVHFIFPRCRFGCRCARICLPTCFKPQPTKYFKYSKRTHTYTLACIQFDFSVFVIERSGCELCVPWCRNVRAAPPPPYPSKRPIPFVVICALTHPHIWQQMLKEPVPFNAIWFRFLRTWLILTCRDFMNLIVDWVNHDECIVCIGIWRGVWVSGFEIVHISTWSQFVANVLISGHFNKYGLKWTWERIEFNCYASILPNTSMYLLLRLILLADKIIFTRQNA